MEIVGGAIAGTIAAIVVGMLVGLGLYWLFRQQRGMAAGMSPEQQTALSIVQTQHAADLSRLEQCQAELQQLTTKYEQLGQAQAEARETLATLTQENKGFAAQLTATSDSLARVTEDAKALRTQREQIAQQLTQAESSFSAECRRTHELDDRLSMTEEQLSNLRAERDRLAKEHAELSTQLTGDNVKFQEKLQFLEDAKKTFENQFQLLGNKIFTEKSESFAALNKTQIEGILNPLGLKIKDFEAKVQQAYDSESNHRTALKTEIEKLIQANSKISEDANNLTRALKGDSQAQGAWGEMVLEKTLEMSGLQRDREYRVQTNFTGDDGSRSRPDVIIDLPEKRQMVIDSKVSLTSYERFINAPDVETRKRELLQHIASVRAHMAGLSKRNYQHIEALSTLDFVIMFIPIESAYSVVVQADPKLTQEALAKDVLIVYPSTLLMALRTIAHVWRYEYQNKNAQEIARQAGALYDKFHGFVASLTEVGSKLNSAQVSFEKAHKQLVSGKGNLVTSADKLKKLGVKGKNELPSLLVEMAQESDSDPAELLEDLDQVAALEAPLPPSMPTNGQLDL